MDCISVLDTIRDAVKSHWQCQPAGPRIVDANAARAAATHSTDTAPAAACDDDPLAQIETTTKTAKKLERVKLHRHKSKYERQGFQQYIRKPTQLRLRNAPTCVGGYDADDYIEVWAMVEKNNELWVDVDSLGWLVAYAVDEHARLGVPHPPKRLKSAYAPNCGTDCPGLWCGFDHRMGRWQFEFVRPVEGLKATEVNLRRYFHLAQMTNRIWTHYRPSAAKPLEESPMSERRAVAKSFVYDWANAIIKGNAESLLQQFGVQFRLSDTAPGATDAPMDHAHSDAESDRGDEDAFLGGVSDAADSDGDDSAG